MASYADGVEKAAGLADAACCEDAPGREGTLVRPGTSYVAIDPSGQPLCAANNGRCATHPRSTSSWCATARNAACAGRRARGADPREGDLVATGHDVAAQPDARRRPPCGGAAPTAEPWLDWGALSPATRRGRLAAAGAARSDAPAGRRAAQRGRRPRRRASGRERRRLRGRGTGWARRPRWPRRWRSRSSRARSVAWDAAHVCAEDDSLGARDLGPAIDRNGHAYRGSWSPVGSKLQFSGCVADYGRGAGRGSRGRRGCCARPQERKEVVSIATVWGDSLWHWACESSVGLQRRRRRWARPERTSRHGASLTFERRGAFVRAWLRRLGSAA